VSTFAPAIRNNMGANLPVLDKLEFFFNHYPLKLYNKGHIFLFPNDQLNNVFYVAGGYVRVFDITKNGNEVVVNIFSPKSLFPMSKALNKTHNHYFYQASTSLMLREAPSDDFIDFLNQNADVAVYLLAKSYLAAQFIRRRMAHLMGGSANNRLVYEIIMLAHDFGTPNDDRYLIAINESEIGARSGLSRETVSREIKTLKNRDLLSVTSGGIVVHSIKSLENKLGSEL
jgi:CRP-like cAMP-binding protein